MKIVVAGPSGYFGGLEVHTSEVIRYLSEAGHSVFCIYVSNNPSVISPQPHSILIPFGSTPWFKFNRILSWCHACLRVRLFRPSLLISVGLGKGYSFVARLAGDRCFKVIQIVTDDFDDADTDVSTIINCFDAVGAQTETLKHFVRNNLNTALPVQVLPCFHQIIQTESQGSKYFTSKNQIKLAYFGRLAANKGLPLLLQAVNDLKSPLLMHFDIWGTGSVENDLRELMLDLPGIHSVVKLCGRYPTGTSYLNLLSSYDGLVLPSQACEGLPLVLLEASSVGLPILATSIGGIMDFTRLNPDSLPIEVGLPALRKGLELFITRIASGSYNRARHQRYFNRHYSRSSIAATWGAMLADFPNFFRAY